MTKGKNNSTSDYLDQLHWYSRYSRRWPIRFQPKWKYKIVYRYPQNTFLRVINSLTTIGLVTFVIYLVFSTVKNDQLALPGKITICFIVGLIIAIISFAIKDGSEENDDSKHIDS